MKTPEEVSDYLTNNPIKGRYHRKLIREFLKEIYPDYLGFTYTYFRFEQKKEVTFTDFKNYFYEEEDLHSESLH